jgi:nitrogen fixation protein FixH
MQSDVENYPRTKHLRERRSGARESSTGQPSERRHGLFWVGLIVALLGSQIVLLTGMVYVAIGDPSFAVEPDYYQKGLNWDTTARQLAQNQRLGWTVRIHIPKESTFSGERAVRFTLVDPQDRPVEGAAVDVVAFPHARGENRHSATLLEVESGVYEGAIPFRRTGVWEFRFAVRKGEDTFTHVVQRNVAPAN